MDEAQIIGKSVEQAREILLKTVRVVERNGEGVIVHADYRAERVNVAIDDAGKILRVVSHG